MTNQEEMEKVLNQRDAADYECYNLLVELVGEIAPEIPFQHKSGAFRGFIKRVEDQIKIRRQLDADFIKFHRAALLDDQLAAARGSL